MCTRNLCLCAMHVFYNECNMYKLQNISENIWNIGIKFVIDIQHIQWYKLALKIKNYNQVPAIY